MSITNGTYKARASGDLVLGTSANKGTPFIEFYFTISEGDCQGKAVRWTSYFTEKTNERSIESLRHCGWQGDDLGEFSDGKLHGLDSNEVEIVVELEEYDKDGDMKTSPKVQWVNKPGGGRYLNVNAAMDQNAALSFGERMRGLVLAMKSKKAPQGDGAEFNHGANAASQPPPNGNPGADQTAGKAF